MKSHLRRLFAGCRDGLAAAPGGARSPSALVNAAEPRGTRSEIAFPPSDAGALSRRSFFKVAGLGAAFGAYAAQRSLAAEHEGGGSGAEVAVLVDLTRCIGCRACENACLTRWGFPGLPRQAMGYGAGEGKLTFKTRTVVEKPVVTNGDGQPHVVSVKKQCMHCLYPACVSVCPVGALTKTELGPVVYDETACIGCRYCILACPFNVPKYEWDNALMPRVGKCDFCVDRLHQGLSPACVAVCPVGALKFGKREAILQEAHARRAVQSTRYASIYGDKIVGGTSWIYLSDTPMDKLGFRTDLPEAPLPSLTWKAISKLPFVIVGVGLALSAVWRWRTRGEDARHA